MYEIVKYKDMIPAKDADTQKRFELIARLSKNFTSENSTALQMDKILVEQLELEEADIKPTVPKNKPSTMRKPNSSTGIEDSFNELFEALKNRQGQAFNVNNDEVKKAIKEALFSVKIKYEDLEESVQKLLSSQPQIIKYDLPPAVTNTFKKPDINSFQSIVDDLVIGNNVLLVGGAGTGKTYLAENLIAKQALGRQHITINCSQWTSPTEIIGGQTMDGYQEGKLIEAWKNGYVMILDELPKIDPNTAGLFNDALAKSKVPNAVIFNARKESFTKHPDFACIATGNIYPDKESISYGANNKQDLSLLDRFSGSVYFIEKNPAIERKIVQNDMIWSISDKIRAVIEEMKYEAQLSLRFMQTSRDAYNLEMQRVKSKGKEGVKAEEGKNFKSTVESYLSTFTEVQQKNIKDRIRFNEIFRNYEYRNFDTNKTLF